jgi:hypothetical protein
MCNDELDTEPAEDDITTTDHIHWYQYGKLVLTTPDPNDCEQQVRRWMEEERFWPNAWFISDHGNAHRLELPEET